MGMLFAYLGMDPRPLILVIVTVSYWRFTPQISALRWLNTYKNCWISKAWANWSPSCQMARYWQRKESPIIWNFTVNYPSIIFFCKQCYAVLPWLYITGTSSPYRRNHQHTSQSTWINPHGDKSWFPMVFPWFSHGFPMGFPHQHLHVPPGETMGNPLFPSWIGESLTRTWRLCWIRSWRRVMPDCSELIWMNG